MDDQYDIYFVTFLCIFEGTALCEDAVGEEGCLVEVFC